MLNKIKIVGKILSFEVKVKEEEEKIESIFYFSLLVPSPSGSLTILRCAAQKEIAQKIKAEVNGEEIVEVQGYLQNEKSGRQIIIRVQKFERLNLNFEDIDSTKSNQVQLQGRVVSLKVQPNNDEPETLSFQIVVPRKKNLFSGFFCRVQGELISKLNSHLKEGRETLVEGFLQTKKMVEKDNGNETKISRFSHIICCAFTFADDDSPIDLNNPDKLTKITGRVKKIDFSKPKEKEKEE